MTEAARDDVRPMCTIPPEGWWCSREPGHDGPCAAQPLEEPWEGPLSTEEQSMIDAAWEKHKAAVPARHRQPSPASEEVTQADREAAARYAIASGNNQSWAERLRYGSNDEGPLVQAFAAHRRAAETAIRKQVLEGAACLVECFPDTRQYPAHSVSVAVRDGAIAAAIRALATDPDAGGDA